MGLFAGPVQSSRKKYDYDIAIPFGRPLFALLAAEEFVIDNNKKMNNTNDNNNNDNNDNIDNDNNDLTNDNANKKKQTLTSMEGTILMRLLHARMTEIEKYNDACFSILAYQRKVM